MTTADALLYYCAGSAAQITFLLLLVAMPTIVVVGQPAASSNGGGGEQQPMKQMCLKVFDISNRTIIKSQDSLNNGARYLASYDGLPDRKQCELKCCSTADCNIAVYHETKDRDCYLFDCGKIESFRCIFSVHDDYLSMGMMTDRIDFDKTKVHEQSKHEMDLNLLKAKPDSPQQQPSVQYYDGQQRGQPQTSGDQSFQRPQAPPDYYSQQRVGQPAAPQRSPTQAELMMDKSVGKPKSPFDSQSPFDRKPAAASGQSAVAANQPANNYGCNQWQWACHRSGDCIANYDVCDGIAQCGDSSDEDAEMCRELRRRKDKPAANAVPALNHRHDLQYPQQKNSGQQQPQTVNAKNKVPSAGGTKNAAAIAADHLEAHGKANNPSPMSSKGAVPPKKPTVQNVVDRESRSGTSTAALLLGLGLLILAAFLVFVSCRLRLARNRLRRKAGRPVANGEGELLINGMYL